MKIYEDSGIRFYRFIAEPKCCKICAGLEGKIFKVSQGQAGVNFRPMHPYCRCSTAMAANPANADFNEWLSLYDSSMDPKSIPTWSEWKARNKTDRLHMAGAINRTTVEGFEYAIKVAEDYYIEVRNRKREFEIEAVAKNSGFSTEDIDVIFSHIFELPHLFSDGEIRRFDGDYDMMQSWLRLREGKYIEPHDITMLKHELLEARIMGKGTDYPYEQAHQQADKEYSYQKECDAYNLKHGYSIHGGK